MSEEIKKKHKKVKSRGRKIFEWILTSFFMAIFLVAFIGQIDGMIHKKDHYNQDIRFGFATFIVETDSMEPLYKVNSAIITYLEDADKIYERYLNNETIDVTFMDVYNIVTSLTEPIKEENAQYRSRTQNQNVPMTHRIIEIRVNDGVKKGEGKYVFMTAGINTEGHMAASNQYQAFTEQHLLGRVIVGSAVLGGLFRFMSSVFGLLILLLIPAFYLIFVSVIDLFKAFNMKEDAAQNIQETKTNNQINLSEEDKKRLKEELLLEMLNKKKGDEK